MSARFLITSDLHQHPAKWHGLLQKADATRPDYILIVGDILPKYEGFGPQRAFFSDWTSPVCPRCSKTCHRN